MPLASFPEARTQTHPTLCLPVSSSRIRAHAIGKEHWHIELGTWPLVHGRSYMAVGTWPLARRSWHMAVVLATKNGSCPMWIPAIARPALAWHLGAMPDQRTCVPLQWKHESKKLGRGATLGRMRRLPNSIPPGRILLLCKSRKLPRLGCCAACEQLQSVSLPNVLSCLMCCWLGLASSLSRQVELTVEDTLAANDAELRLLATLHFF